MHKHTWSLRGGLQWVVVMMVKYGFLLWQVKLSASRFYAGADEVHSPRCCCVSRKGPTTEEPASQVFSSLTCSLSPLGVGRCSPFLNKAVSPSVTSAPPMHSHTITVSYSCQTAKPSLPPGQNRSCLSLRMSLSLSLSLSFHAMLPLSPTFISPLFFPPLGHLGVTLLSCPAMESSGDLPRREGK